MRINLGTGNDVLLGPFFEKADHEGDYLRLIVKKLGQEQNTY